MFRRLTPAQAIVENSNSYASIPLPADLAPTTNAIFDTMSDDEIFALPAHFAVHLMRTAAQNGAQVISPRQVPSSTCLGRVPNDHVSTFLHVVGSEASFDTEWPVFPGEEPAPKSWFADEPLRKSGAPLAARKPAQVAPLAEGLGSVSNPFHAAWIKARAAVDLMSRDDVGGDAEALATAFENVWAAPAGSLMQSASLTVAMIKPLREHAMTTDTAFARCLAPIQNRRVVTVAVSSSTSAAFGQFRAIDWTALRVSAEARFMLTASNECRSLMELATTMPIGHMLGTVRPPGVLSFHPTPGSVWSYEPASFAVFPDETASTRRTNMPALIRDALVAAETVVSPEVAARAYQVAAHWTQTMVDAPSAMEATDDVFGNPYALIAHPVLDWLSTPRHAAAAMRDWFFTAVVSGPVATAAKFARCISVIKEGAAMFRGVLAVDARMVMDVSFRLNMLDSTLAIRMEQTAARLDADSSEWFRRMSQMIPESDRPEFATARGWARLAVHFALRPPDEKWAGIVDAIGHTTRSLHKFRPTDFDLMGDPGTGSSIDVIRARSNLVFAHHQAVYGASYDGAALASTMLARAADRNRRINLAKALRATAYGWALRSRFCKSTFLRITRLVESHPEHATFWDHTTADTPWEEPMSAAVIAVPYRAFEAWRAGSVAAGLANMDNVVVAPSVGQVSWMVRAATPFYLRMEFDTLIEHRRMMSNLPRCVRYAVKPDLLGDDLERYMQDTIADVMAVARHTWEDRALAAGDVPPTTAAGANRLSSGMGAVLDALDHLGGDRSSRKTGWEWLVEADDETASAVTDMVVVDETVTEVMSMVFDSFEDFDAAIGACIGAAASERLVNDDVFN